MIELYRGSINTWECDQMGHMNVRFYVAKAMEGSYQGTDAKGGPACSTVKVAWKVGT